MKLKPTNGKCSAEKAEFAAGGKTSELRMSLSSTSKFDVSVGDETSGMYGAVLSLSVPQLTPSNHGCFYNKINQLIPYFSYKMIVCTLKSSIPFCPSRKSELQINFRIKSFASSLTS